MRILTTPSSRRLAVLGMGFAAALASFLPPLADIAQELFAAHMVQHLLLIAVAAPLLVAGGLELAVPPLAGWALFVGLFLFWHWPLAFRWAALDPLTAALELASILFAALCFWSGVLGRSALNDGGRALLVMTAAVLTDLPGVVMVFAPTPICTMPGENASAFHMTPLADQQLAGLLMWVPANLVFFSIATFLFARWMGPARGPMVTS
ncbi:MAG: cytochrome c oxidase assembly protein [Alphaproteobacteria bacterium]|nr:cytochrome c oxidase assembly protein [Alphaproteobacteria bacterium]